MLTIYDIPSIHVRLERAFTVIEPQLLLDSNIVKWAMQLSFACKRFKLWLETAKKAKSRAGQVCNGHRKSQAEVEA